MKKIVRAWLMCCLLGVAASAHAQRTAVPVMNFENIPVSLSTDKKLTAEQVRRAFMVAGAATGWDISQKAPGELQAAFRKNQKHEVVIVITYDAEKYSTRFVNSINMKYEELTPPVPMRLADAAQAQKQQFVGRPETPFAKPDPKAVIHPFYERWVHDMFHSVRAQLKVVE